MKKVLILSMVVFFLLGTTIVIASDTSPTPPTPTPMAKLVVKAYRKNNLPLELTNIIVAPGEELYLKLSLENISSSISKIKTVHTKIKYDDKIFEEIKDDSDPNKTDITCDAAFGTKIYNDFNDEHELNLISENGVSNVDGMIEIASIKIKAKTNIQAQKTKVEFENNEITDEHGQINISSDTVVVNLEIGEEVIPDKPLAGIVITKDPTKIAYKPGEKFDPKGMEVTAIYTDKTKMKINDYTYAPKGETENRELKLTDKFITIYYLGKTKDLAITVNEEGRVPQAGLADHPFITLSILAIAVISFIGIRKYRNI